MSWLRSAVNRAVEVGGRNSVTRTFRSYADTVVQNVSGGARIAQDHKGTQNQKSFKLTLKSLEENSVSCRGSERTQLLNRWLLALKEAKRVNGTPLDGRSAEENPALSSTNDSMVLYSDSGGEPMNFWDVFLHSQALEGLTLSMILEPPNEEEVPLLLDVFGLCLTGGKEVHRAILNNIQDLGRAFSSFQDEVLVKREEMLQFAQGAIAGLKVSADVARIDAEVSILSQKIDNLVESLVPLDEGHESKTENATPAVSKDLKEAVVEIQLYSKLEELLLEKKSIKSGESPEIHFQKIDKLKVLAESLASCSRKAEERISDHRHQKEEAIDFRVVKAKEVIETEKELAAEISVLKKQRDDLEAELKKVNTSLTAAFARLKKTREQRDKFDEASNEILIHLKTKEDDLLRSVASCQIEADVVHTWTNFLEDTWRLQSSHAEQKERETDHELEKYRKYFMKLITCHTLACKEELQPAISLIRTCARNLKDFREGKRTNATADTALSIESKPCKLLEEEYLDLEVKIVTIFTIIDNMKELLDSRQGNNYREDFDEIKMSFYKIDRMREEFKSIERLTMSSETVSVRPGAPAKEKMPGSSSQSPRTSVSPNAKDIKHTQSAIIRPSRHLDPESELAKLESEFKKESRDYHMEEIEGWEI